MKKAIFCLSLLYYSVAVPAQPVPDSLKAKLRIAKTGEEKGRLIDAHLKGIKPSDSIAIQHILELSSWFKKQNDEAGADYTDLHLAFILERKGDSPAALNISFPILSRFEKRTDSYGILAANTTIAGIYFHSKDFERAAEYYKKSIALTPPEEVNKLSGLYNAIGCVYGEAGWPDSGMVYAQKAVNIDSESKNYQALALSISTLAENYIAAKEYDIALPFLRKSSGFYEDKKAMQIGYLDAYLKNDFAQVFLATQQYDSANYYAHRALLVSIPYQYKDQSMRSYEYLYRSFEATNRQDSVNKYFRLAMNTKDSIFDLEKIKSIQALSFREQLRQQQLETDKQKAADERNQNIQFALIALGIISFVILFLLLSRSFITNTKLIEFFSVMALLLVFEFLNLLLHPYIERITHHTPVFMLLALVCIAALLIPLHHRIEKWSTEKLVEKNKAIRLAKAQKTLRILSEEKQEEKSSL